MDIVRNWRELTAPPYEPVTTSLLRQWCRIDSDDSSQDSVLTLLISAARQRAESISGRILVERSIELVMDDLPDSESPVEFPFAPVQSVSYVRYRDSSNVAQEISGSPTQWELDTVNVPNRMIPLYGTDWPDTSQRAGNVRIGCIAGYAPTGSPTDEAAYQSVLPDELKLWINARISTWYENREQVVIGATVADLPRDYVDGLLDGLIVHRRFA